jgi:hypothetical protein
MVALASPAAETLFAQIDEPQQPEVLPLQTAEEPAARDQLILLILQTNRSATRSWLERFDDAALRQYLQHLEASQMPRGRAAIWVRTGSARAITMADAPE